MKRILDPATWPRRVRNLAGVAWIGAILVFVTVVWHAPQELWHAPSRIAHAWSCAFVFEGAPSWSPDNRSIAFAKEVDCGVRLFVVDRDGSHLRLLAASRKNDVFPNWRPDGRALAFSTQHGRVATLRADGSGRRAITTQDSEFGSSWSPDGRELAYTYGLTPGSDGGDLETTLAIVRADGSGMRKVLRHTIGPGTPAWSPDGTQIAVTGGDGIYVIRPDGRSLTRVAEEYFGQNPVAPAWSPDGRMLSFVDDQGVQIIDVPTRRWLRSIHIAGSYWGDATSWSPSGREIAFSLSRGEHPGIYVMRADGRALHRITTL